MTTTISQFMDNTGFYGGNFEDLTLDLVDEYFTEKNFRDVFGCDDEDLEKIAYDLDFEDGIVDWDWIQGEVRWVLSGKIAEYVRENEDCSLTYELVELGDLGELSDDKCRQYWNINGRFARNREDWEKILLWIGYGRGDSSWQKAEKRLADFHHFVDDELFPVYCHVYCVLGGGTYDITDL